MRYASLVLNLLQCGYSFWNRIAVYLRFYFWILPLLRNEVGMTDQVEDYFF